MRKSENAKFSLIEKYDFKKEKKKQEIRYPAFFFVAFICPHSIHIFLLASANREKPKIQEWGLIKMYLFGKPRIFRWKRKGIKNEHIYP